MNTIGVRRSVFRIVHRQLHVRSWQLSSAPYGSLRITLPFACNLCISPLDPHQSDWTQTNVHLHIPTSASMNEIDARNVASKLAIRATESQDMSSARIEAPTLQSGKDDEQLLLAHMPELRVEIPGLHNLCVELADGSMRLSDTIEGDLSFRSNSASIYINKLRSTSASLKTRDGDVEARILQGNVDIESQTGCVKLSRAQGNDIKVKCGAQITAGSLYGGRLTLISGGEFHADAVHGEADVQAEGAVMSAVQGSLRLKSKGDVRVTLADEGTKVIDVDAEGDVHLGIRKGLEASFDVKADTVCDEVGVLQDSESELGGSGQVCSVRVKATKRVTLHDDQWAGRMLGLTSARRLEGSEQGRGN